MPDFPEDPSVGNFVLGTIITILAILIFALVFLVFYFYLHLRRLQRQYDTLLHRPCGDPSLFQRIREQRKSAVLCIADCGGPSGQQADSNCNAACSNSISPRTSSDCPGNFKDDASLNDPEAGESWAIRKVRSMERLTELSNELTPRKEYGDPFVEFPANRGGGATTGHDGKVAPQTNERSTSIVEPGTSRNVPILQKDTKNNNQDLDAAQTPNPSLLVVPTVNKETSARISPESENQGHSFSKWIRGTYRTDNRQCYVKSNTSGYFAASAPKTTINEIPEIPPHARIDSCESSVPNGNVDLHNSEDFESTSKLGFSGLGGSKRRHSDVPRPFLERTFDLSLAFPQPHSHSSRPKHTAPGKIRHYIRNARTHRRFQSSTAGTFPRRSVAAVLSHTGRSLPKSTKRQQEKPKKRPVREEPEAQNLETITECPQIDH
ncbi:hypothetical protein TWF694_003324 [Orbilia ellipsospora]|uniref:Uncharacterized protein n=1 Tax=Orbilia ellipsospora TaxID=2528407 RepID=A0AAV9X255_9PEZI